MVITELAVLKWLHILAMVYWLGGEWGVFNTSTHVINRELSMEERRRHMQTAYHIDYWLVSASLPCFRWACIWAPSGVSSPTMAGTSLQCGFSLRAGWRCASRRISTEKLTSESA